MIARANRNTDITANPIRSTKSSIVSYPPEGLCSHMIAIRKPYSIVTDWFRILFDTSGRITVDAFFIIITAYSPPVSSDSQ